MTGHAIGSPTQQATALTLETTRLLADRIGQVQTFGHFINGEWIDGNSGEIIELTNPATRKLLARTQSGDAIDANRAVQAAYAAFPAWSRTSPGRRQEIILAMAARLRARFMDFAMMECLNNGKTIVEATGDIRGAIEQLEFFAGGAHHLHGEILDSAEATVLIHREPIGVVAQIIPWNVPLVMATMKIAPALAAGCTIVLKPAETVCLSVLEFAREISDLLPPGVLNVITGYGADVGGPLVTHPKVRKVAFTGSRATAQKIIQYASVNMIPQTMELGGKSANIVCEDADLEAAAESVVLTTTANKGEVCLAGSRVFVHRKVREPFLDRLTALMATVRQGDPIDPKTQLGAQSSKGQFDRVRSYIELGKSEGATAVFGGDRAQISGFEDGLFIQPTIFTNVRNDMRIAQEEIFGPVTGVIEWDDEDELLRGVNDSIYGLGGGLWTQNLTRAHRIARAIDTGTIWINRYYDFRAGIPLGGYKQSGFGRENSYAVLDHYTVSKSVVINLNPGPLNIFGPPTMDV